MTTKKHLLIASTDTNGALTRQLEQHGWTVRCVEQHRQIVPSNVVYSGGLLLSDEQVAGCCWLTSKWRVAVG